MLAHLLLSFPRSISTPMQPMPMSMSSIRSQPASTRCLTKLHKCIVLSMRKCWHWSYSYTFHLPKSIMTSEREWYSCGFLDMTCAVLRYSQTACYCMFHIFAHTLEVELRPIPNLKMRERETGFREEGAANSVWERESISGRLNIWCSLLQNRFMRLKI